MNSSTFVPPFVTRPTQLRPSVCSSCSTQPRMTLLSHEKLEVIFSSEHSEMAKYKFELQIPAEFSKQRRKKSIAALKQNAHFKGFRKGTIPPFIMKDLNGFVLRDSIGDMLDEAIKELGLDTLEGEAAEPVVDEKELLTRFKVGEDFTFSCEISLQKAIDLDSFEATDTEIPGVVELDNSDAIETTSAPATQ